MRIPRHWERGVFKGVDQRGKPAEFVAWGWSVNNAEEARDMARQRAKAIFLRLSATGSWPREQDRAAEYDYLDSPPREEIVSQNDGPASPEGPAGAEPAAIVTRNRYGALVLNAAHVLFVDIDLPPPRQQSFVESLKTSLSKAQREKFALERHHRIVDNVTNWSRKNPSYGFRMYQTKAGYRLLFTNKLFQPLSAEVKGIFQELGSDQLYQRLTEKQRCFRARLTPKPWRIGTSRPATRFPRNPTQHAAYLAWLREYDTRAEAYATCCFIDTIGHQPIADPEIQRVIALHDRHAKADSALPLA